jgi:Rps23 Pro-64 3,4-dihydroxylase Tpa1-like proline 4-hydroxylase
MKFEFIYDPVPLIIIRDIFSKKESEKILAEAIKNKSSYRVGAIADERESNKNSLKYRDNLSSYYDEIYIKDRTQSELLSSIDKLMNDENFGEILSSFAFPVNLFNTTNFHVTQVSRYGDQGQRYKYHTDFDGKGRIVTLVYYFHKEPKKYKGGEIQFTRSPISKGKVIDKNETPITITPENNMMVIFGSKVAHTVLPTISPKTFDKGRFSANIWVGRNPSFIATKADE